MWGANRAQDVDVRVKKKGTGVLYADERSRERRLAANNVSRSKAKQDVEYIAGLGEVPAPELFHVHRIPSTDPRAEATFESRMFARPHDGDHVHEGHTHAPIPQPFPNTRTELLSAVQIMQLQDAKVGLWDKIKLFETAFRERLLEYTTFTLEIFEEVLRGFVEIHRVVSIGIDTSEISKGRVPEMFAASYRIDPNGRTNICVVARPEHPLGADMQAYNLFPATSRAMPSDDLPSVLTIDLLPDQVFMFLYPCNCRQITPVEQARIIDQQAQRKEEEARERRAKRKRKKPRKQ